MKRVGKNTAAIAASVVCIVLIICTLLPLSGAQAADTTPPVTNASLTGTMGNNGWNTTTVTVSLQADDNVGGSGVAHTYYRINGSQPVTYTSSFSLSDGSHTLLFFSDDNAGNTEPITNGRNNISVKVDTEKPIMNLTIIGNLVGEYYNGTTRLNLTAKDNCSGVSSISYSYDNVHWMSYTGNITNLPDGSYTFYYGCYDAAGNAYNNSTSIKVFNPEIGFSPEPNLWYTDVNYFYIYFTLPPSGDVDHVDFAFNNPTNWYHSNDSRYYPINHTAQGNTTIYYRAVSASGLVSDVKKVWYGIDSTAPTVSLEISGDKSSKGWYNGDITVKVIANDPGYATGYWSWNNKSWNTYTDPFTIKWQSSRRIYYKASDIAGREVYGNQFIYFRPAGMDQGAMSNSVYINGETISGNPTATGTPTIEPTPRPTIIPNPTPELVPSTTAVPDISTGSGNPLAIAVLVGVLAFLGIAAAAVYLFMTKRK